MVTIAGGESVNKLKAFPLDLNVLVQIGIKTLFVCQPVPL